MFRFIITKAAPIILFYSIISSTFALQAKAMSVDDLRNNCNSSDESALILCIGYFSGYVHGYIAGQKGERHACIRASSDTIARQFMKFTDSRPELWGHPAQWGIAGFLELAYPCSE